MGNVKVHTNNRSVFDVDTTNMHALISWRSVVAGLLVAMFTMIGLVGLGLAFGGIGLDEDTSARSAGIFTGVWFMTATLISLFVGSYFAARVSKFKTGRIGSAQGLVIASLFLGFFLFETVSMIGLVGSSAGRFIGRTGNIFAQGMERANQNPMISNTIGNLSEDAVADLNLRSDPQTVAEGIGSRLLNGDTEGAKNYLARQAGMTPTEADARIAQMKAQVDKYLADAKEATATGLRSAGWSLFLLVALGAFASVAGGALGSVINFRKPLVVQNPEELYPHGRTV